MRIVSIITMERFMERFMLINKHESIQQQNLSNKEWYLNGIRRDLNILPFKKNTKVLLHLLRAGPILLACIFRDFEHAHAQHVC